MARNFLIETKELKARVYKVFNEIDNNENFLKTRNGKPINEFLECYSGADMWYTNMYNVLYNVITVFEDETLTFAEKGKLARAYFAEEIKALERRRDLALQDCFSDWLTDQKDNEDRYTEYEDCAGGTYTVYEEPTYEDFIENIGDQSFTYNYEEYENCEAALYNLGVEFCDIIEIYY